MKTVLSKFSILSIFLLSLFACEKEEDQMILQVGTPPALSTTANNLILTEEEADNEAITISWSEAEFGFPAAVTYTLEVDTAGNGFQQPFTIDMGAEKSKKYTVAELNTLLNKMGYVADEAQDVPIRVKASVSDQVEPVYSNVATITATPYSTFIEPAYIYVPGAYQGWSPETAPALASVEDNGIYQGIVSFVGAEDLEFKFTDERSWDLNWGAGATEGTLETNGPNLTVPTADNYMLEVDLNNLTWSAELHSWGLVGSATTGDDSGWGSDLNMVYDNEDEVWRLTTELFTGEVKFRFNDDWALNYGDDDTSDDSLNQNGANIQIPEAGTYEIILDVSDEENPTYSITKV